jgi:anti-sigma regulatory factor (Ser/Thr protein kinase)
MSADLDHGRAIGATAGPFDPRPERLMDESFPAVPDAVARARLTLIERLRRLGADDRSLGDVAIAVSEACTNAVVHAYRKAARGTFDVAAVVEDDLVHVAVTDHGAGLQPRTDSPGLGLGLPLIASVSDSLAITSVRPDTKGNGNADNGGRGTMLSMTFTLRRQAQPLL